jgi:hypothetical protein
MRRRVQAEEQRDTTAPERAVENARQKQRLPWSPGRRSTPPSGIEFARIGVTE